MEPQAMVKLIEEHYHSFWQGDLADLDSQLSSDFVDEAAPPGAPPGPASTRAAAEMGRAAFPDMTVTVEDSVVGGGIVAVRAHWRGTHLGALMGREPTGRSIEFTGMVMWRFNAEGEINRRWTQMDLGAAFRQLDD